MSAHVRGILTFVILGSVSCASGPPTGEGGASTPQEDLITVRVTNTTGERISVAYTFARTPPTHLGMVPRGGEGVAFQFPWEPGRMQFVAEGPQVLLTSNGLSSRQGDVFELHVSRREARAIPVEAGR